MLHRTLSALAAVALTLGTFAFTAPANAATTGQSIAAVAGDRA